MKKVKLTKRSSAAVLLLPFITFGIYSWYWAVKTKGELNRNGADIPTAWIWLIPFVGFVWWIWKYAQGFAKVTGKYDDAVAFLLLFLLGNIGQAIIQEAYNGMSE